MHSILLREAFEEPNASTTYEELLRNIGLNLERKYGIVSNLGSHVTSVPKDKIDKVKEGIEKEKNKGKDAEQQQTEKTNQKTEPVKKEEPVKTEKPKQDANKNKRRATGRKSRVAIAPNSIIHRIKRNFGRKKVKANDDELNFKNNKAKITNRMKVHVITLPVILRGKVTKGIQCHSIKKAKKNINKQVAEINRLRHVIDKKKKYNEYQQEKIDDRNRRKEEKFKNNKYSIYEEDREEIERQERLADMEKVNKRDEKERIAQAKADFKYALKQHAKDQKLQAKNEKREEKDRLKEEKAKERELLKERQRKLKEQQRKEINDMLRELKEQQIRETEMLRQELDRLNAVMDKNSDTIDELEQEEDEVKGRRTR